MLAKIYDSLTIILFLVGLLAVTLIFMYRDLLFKRADQITKKDSHEYLVPSKLKISSSWLSGSKNLREATVFVPENTTPIIFASDLNSPQMIEIIPESQFVLVTEPRTGNILVLSDTDYDGSSDIKDVFISGLENPYGIDFYKNDLYVGVKTGVIVFKDFSKQLKNHTNSFEKVISDLPLYQSMGKEIAVANDRIFVSIPASCNYCVEADQRRGSVAVYNLAGAAEEIYVYGLHNATFLDFIQGSLVSSEVSIESTAFNVSDEINVLSSDNFYGWPYFVNNNEVFTPLTSNPPSGLISTYPDFLLPQGSYPVAFAFFDNLLGQNQVLTLALRNKQKVITIPFNNEVAEYKDLFVWSSLNKESFSPVGVAKYAEGLLISDELNGVLVYLKL